MALADRIRRSTIGPASQVSGGRKEGEGGQRTRTRREKRKNSHCKHSELNSSARVTLRASDPEKKSTSKRSRHEERRRIEMKGRKEKLGLKYCPAFVFPECPLTTRHDFPREGRGLHEKNKLPPSGICTTNGGKPQFEFACPNP